MLKKVLCIAIIVMTIMSICCTVSVGAQGVDVSHTNAKAYQIGDVDMDGKVSVLDAREIQLYESGLATLSDFQKKLSAVTDSNTVSVMDATEIQRYLAQLSVNKKIGTLIMETSNDDIDVKDTAAVEKAVEEAFMEYVNEERVKVGVQPLTVNSDLYAATRIRKNEIVETFSHERPDGSSCFTAIEDSSGFIAMGENIAYNGGILSFEQETIAEDIDYAARFLFGQFKSSEGHYKNMIMKDYNCHGVGVTIKRSEIYMVHMFGEVYEAK